MSEPSTEQRTAFGAGEVPTPAQCMAFLDQAAADLDDLGKRLEAAHVLLGDAETIWQEKKDIALIEIVEEYEKAGKRLPGEDVRLALARKRVDFQHYADWTKAKRLVLAIERRAKRLETAVEARRSTLKRMDGALGLEGYGPEGQTFGRGK